MILIIKEIAPDISQMSMQLESSKSKAISPLEQNPLYGPSPFVGHRKIQTRGSSNS